MELKLAFSSTTNIIIITIFFLLSFIKLLNNRSKAKKLPPGPGKLPIIGSLHYLATGSLPQYTFSKLSKIYGPLMHLKLGGISAVVVSSPEIAKQFMKTHDVAFGGRPTTFAADVFSYNKSGLILTPCNAHWKQIRKICVLELLSNKRVKSYSSIREDEVSNLVSFIKKSKGSPINLSAQLFSLSTSLFCRAAFGENLPSKDELFALVEESTLANSSFILGDIFPLLSFLAVFSGSKLKLQKIHKKMDVMFEKIINKRREYNLAVENTDEKRNKKEDLLNVLFRLQEENKQEFPITDKNIKAVIYDMFAAGTETSALVIEWAMSEIIKNPRVMEKLESEIRREIKNVEEGRDTRELHYLKMVIKETLRLHPPGPLLIPRECTEAREINGYTIPVKTLVIINAWAIARDPEFWGEDADKFIPERFEISQLDFSGNNFEYLPFGSGRRMCPGISFGLATVEIVLTQLVYHFNWKLPNHIKPEELDMTVGPGLAGKRENPLYLVADFNKAS